MIKCRTCGGGGGGTVSLIISNEIVSQITTNSALFNWQTNLFATSQVICSAEGEPHELNENNPPYYGYSFSYPKLKDENKVTYHTVNIPDCQPCTKYYCRVVSEASPAKFSQELIFTTKCPEEETEEKNKNQESEKILPTQPPVVVAPVVSNQSSVSENQPEEEVKIEETPELMSEISAENMNQKQISENNNWFNNLLGAIGFFDINCLPAWIILIIALYPFYKGWQNKGNKKMKLWMIVALTHAVLMIVFYIFSVLCVPVLISVLIIFIDLILGLAVLKD